MTRFVFVPGAGGAAWYWHRVVPELGIRGHEAIALDLPGPDPRAGLPEYAKAITDAMVGDAGVVVVAQSMGGFAAAMACAQCPARKLVLVNAMIPLPGETPGDWWAGTGAVEAREAAAREGGYATDFDLKTYFLHDIPADVLAGGEEHARDEADIAFGQPCAIESWPRVSTKVIVGRDDRFFPVGFQRRVTRERLGCDTDEILGGHLVALSHPSELVDRLCEYIDHVEE